MPQVGLDRHFHQAAAQVEVAQAVGRARRERLARRSRVAQREIGHSADDVGTGQPQRRGLVGLRQRILVAFEPQQ